MQELYEMIPIGSENAVRIKVIAEMWDMRHRAARRLIEVMWYNDLPTINTGKGYYRPKDESDFDSEELYILSYVHKLLKKVYRIRKAKERFRLVSFLSKEIYHEQHKTAV